MRAVLLVVLLLFGSLASQACCTSPSQRSTSATCVEPGDEEPHPAPACVSSRGRCPIPKILDALLLVVALVPFLIYMFLAGLDALKAPTRDAAVTVTAPPEADPTHPPPCRTLPRRYYPGWEAAR